MPLLCCSSGVFIGNLRVEFHTNTSTKRKKKERKEEGRKEGKD